MAQITVSDTFQASIRKQPLVVQGLDNWPKQSLVKVFEYGLQRILNDASAAAKGETREAELANAMSLAQKKLDALVSGELRASRVASPVDPVEAEILEMAITTVRQNVASAGLKDVTASQIKAKAREVAQEHDSYYRPIAEAKVNSLKASPITVDLKSLVIMPGPSEEGE